MVVFGIDPGTAITGYSVLDESTGGNLVAIDYGVIRTPANTKQEDRLKLLFNQLNSLITLHRPSSCAVEKLFFQKNVKTALSVGEARGVIILCFALAGVPVYEYAPVEIKQAVAGYGNADKKQVQYMVKEILQLDEIPQPDDAADALAAAVCHMHSRKIIQLSE